MVCFFKDGWANWGCHEKIALNDGASVASRKRGLEKFRLDDSVRTTLPIAIGTSQTALALVRTPLLSTSWQEGKFWPYCHTLLLDDQPHPLLTYHHQINPTCQIAKFDFNWIVSQDNLLLVNHLTGDVQHLQFLGRFRCG